MNSKDGDPQTPIYARMLMDSFSGKYEHSGSHDGGQPSPASSPNLQRLREIRNLHQSLQAAEKERDRLRATVEESSSASSSGVDVEASLSGERLKWQMEVTNLRKEYESTLQKEKERYSEERTTLESTVASLEEACASLRETSGKAGSNWERSLMEAKQR